MNTERELNNIADVAKGIQEGSRTMTDLVFNPSTGEFEQRPKGTTRPQDGEVATTMAEIGFAWKR